MKNRILLLLLIGFVSAPDPRKHQSKEVVDPDAIFLISNSTLGDNGDQTVPYLVYQSATLVDGPYNDTYAVHFSAGSASYMDLNNANGAFDGIDAFTWAFYLKVDNVTPGEKYIFGYNGGCELVQNGSTLIARFKGYAMDNSTGVTLPTGLDVATDLNVSTDTIDLEDFVNQWLYVVVTFSAYNDFISVMYVEDGSSTKEKLNLGTSSSDMYTFARATGDIRFGNSFDGNQQFEGSIACIEFKQMSLLKTPVVGLEQKCDPSVWVDHSILGRVKPMPETTTVSSSTTASTGPTTTISSASATPTVSSTTSTVTGSPATASPGTTLIYDALPPLSFVDSTSEFSYDVIGRCQRFSRLGVDATYKNAAEVLDARWVTNIRGCTDHCLRNDECATFVLRPSYLNGFACYIGVDTTDLRHEVGAMFYQVDRA